MIRLFFFLACFYCLNSQAQSGVNSLNDARSLAMGGTKSISRGLQSLFANPAGMMSVDAFGARATVENRFLLSELQNIGMGAIFASDGGNFGIKAAQFGFEDYRESQLSLLYARNLSENLSIGAEILYWNLNIPEYGTQGFFTFTLGLQSKLSESFSLGAYIINPIRQQFAEDQLTYAIIMLGLAYKAGEKVEIIGEVEKDLDFPARFKAGLDYQISDPISLRLGFGTAPTNFSFGFALEVLPQVKVDIAASRHEVLGFTPGISISYRARKQIQL